MSVMPWHRAVKTQPTVLEQLVRVLRFGALSVPQIALRTGKSSQRILAVLHKHHDLFECITERKNSNTPGIWKLK